ncbi:MAG: hypothetical protein KA297_19525 [Kofleriaceae bacterium]|nr:hypothetical protein [Kofleriaceae bacterium]MBP6838895.1 hypothetical protein [Kofleriaceae bacterium]
MVAALATAAAACSGDAAVRIAVTPAVRGACTIPADGSSLFVTALTDDGEVRSNVSLAAPTVLADLPASTRQITLEIVAGGGGIAAAGKSAPLDLRDPPDEVRIATAPIDGFCPVNQLGRARRAPLLAALPDGALIVGGEGAGAAAEVSAERYQLATGAFVPVTTPAILRQGFVGAALTTMPDGQLVVTGGPHSAYVTFDPASAEFGLPVLFELRFFHAAVALDARRLLVAGGCGSVVAGQCSAGSALRTTTVLDLVTGEPIDGPALTLDRIGGAAYLERSEAGREVVVVAGGVDLTGALVPAERLDLATGQVTVVTGAVGVSAPLPGGTVLTALAPTGAPPAPTAAVVVPGRSAACVVRPTAARAGAVLVPLEDGAVLALGDPADQVERYQPQDGTWQRFTPAGEPRALLGRVGAVRLVDGTVLVVGGEDEGGAPSRQAHLFRPRLLGPRAATATVTPLADDTAIGLISTDPCLTPLEAGRYRILAAGAGVGAVALVGGPLLQDGALSATVRVAAGGLAVITHARADLRIETVLRVGQPALVGRRRADVVEPLCTGGVVASLGAGEPLAVGASVRDGSLEVRVEGQVVAQCALAAEPAGVWGLGAVDAGGDVAIETITARR